MFIWLIKEAANRFTKMVEVFYVSIKCCGVTISFRMKIMTCLQTEVIKLEVGKNPYVLYLNSCATKHTIFTL